MKARSKKYYERRKKQSGQTKGSVSDAGYNELQEASINQSPKKNPAPPKSEDDPKEAPLIDQGEIGEEDN